MYAFRRLPWLALLCWLPLPVALSPTTAEAASFSVWVEYSAIGFAPDRPGALVPEARLAGSFSFVLDDGGLTGMGVETRAFTPSAASGLSIDGAGYDQTNTSVLVTWIDGELAELLFASPAEAPRVDPVPGEDGFALLLLGSETPAEFGFEQMRYGSTGVPDTVFETTEGTARVQFR